MKEISHFLLNENTNGLYKREAISSIQLTKEVADKINELVDAYNGLNKKSLAKDQEQDGRINKAVIYMKDNLVNSIHDLFELLTASGDLQNIIDNIYSSQVAQNKELLSYLNIFATPEMFGAKGDGKTDDTIAINRCLSSGVKRLTFPDATYLISDSLVIPSGVSVDFGYSKFIAIKSEPMLKIFSGSSNIRISGGVFDGNYKANAGLMAYHDIKNITIENVKFQNIKGDGRTYGIALPCFNSTDVLVNNCTIENVESIDNGEIADAKGWAKGIIVGFNGWLNEFIPATVDVNTYAVNTVIKNCKIRNIKSAEDGDGIYIEGITDKNRNPMMFDLSVMIDSNYFENCGKRFIKVLPSGGTTIKNNYGISTKNTWQTERMHSFISVYAPNCVIENNEFHCRKNHCLYGIDIGIQAMYGEYIPGNIHIRNNRLYNSANREGDNTAMIYYCDYDGYFDEIYIQNNHISASYYGILINNPDGTKTKLHINDNMFTSPKDGFRVLQVISSLALIEFTKNYIDDKYANSPICIDGSEYVNILDNVMTVNVANIVNAKYCLIKNNLLFNIATSRRFTVNATGWSFSINNNDSAGGSISW